MFYEIGVVKKIHKIHSKTPLLKAVLCLHFYWEKKSGSSAFLLVLRNFPNNFFVEYRRTAASVNSGYDIDDLGEKLKFKLDITRINRGQCQHLMNLSTKEVTILNSF